MRLLAPQRIRELLEIAENAGFAKTDFTVEERQSRIGRGQTVHAIRYRETQYYFAFEYTMVFRQRRGVPLTCVEFSPGIGRLIETTLPIQDWPTEIEFFVRWLEILKDEIENQSKEAAPAPMNFTEGERVQIYYVVHDFLRADQGWPYRIDDPKPMAELEEALKRQLSRLSIGEGNADDNIKAFILSASYNDVLTLLQMLPLIPLFVAERHRPRTAWRDWDKGFVQLSQSMYPAINDVLEKTSSPARFTEKGEFHREGLGTTTPLALLRLPSREVLFRDVASALQGDKTASVVFVDLDGFKQVNDKLGHAAGDKCLEKVAEVLGALAVNRGKVYRYGGDEFVLLLPNAISMEAAATAERVRTSIEQARVGGEIRVTASVGVIASDALKSATAEEFVDAADKAAYVSKHAGKNKVTVGPVSSELK